MSSQLNNGNRCGDPHTAPRCGAKTRRGSACQAPAMANGRCRLHGARVLAHRRLRVWSGVAKRTGSTVATARKLGPRGTECAN
jgi:hypothetical protein